MRETVTDTLATSGRRMRIVKRSVSTPRALRKWVKRHGADPSLADAPYATGAPAVGQAVSPGVDAKLAWFPKGRPGQFIVTLTVLGDYDGAAYNAAKALGKLR